MRTRAEIECWLTDMDGVLVHENTPIPGASALLQQWTDLGNPFLVLTNNSIFTPRDLSARLRASGLIVPEESIWTSALATADFLRSQMPGGTAFVIGEAGRSTACCRPLEPSRRSSRRRSAWSPTSWASRTR